MAQVTVIKRAKTVTLEMSAVEAAVVLGLVGTAVVQQGTPDEIRFAIKGVQFALQSAIPERMSDYGASVRRGAQVTGRVGL